MNTTANGFLPRELMRVIGRYPLRLLVPAALVAGVVGFYAVVRSNTWEASQALVVRNEAGAKLGQERPGRFDRPEQMQTVQETIMELSRSHSVLAATLVAVDGSGASRPAGWPREADVEQLRSAVRMVPPNGAEFGKTEVFYLKVKDRNRDRAVKLVAALCRQLQEHYQQMRDQNAQSMVGELAHTLTLSQQGLHDATGRLEKLEASVGTDLSELRILEKSPSGNSDLRSQLISLETELRDAGLNRRSNEELRDLLLASTRDAGHLLAAPNRLLESQPALRRLKDGLIDAQLRTSELRGNLSDEHPRVLAAVAAEQEIRRNLSNELNTAIRGVDIDLRLTSARVESLSAQLDQIRGRLDNLAAVRAAYSNLINEVQHRQQLLTAAEENLADARASHTAASSANLISLIDRPDAGGSPVGPGRVSILFGGILGGLAIGFGVVLLTVQPERTEPAAAATNGLAARTKPTPGVSLRQALSRLGMRRNTWN